MPELIALQPLVASSTYEVNEVVAVAQSYEDVCKTHCKWLTLECAADEKQIGCLQCEPGWNNKMFTASYYLPHHIRITDIRVQHLQDITDEECLAEGIFSEEVLDAQLENCVAYTFGSGLKHWDTPKEAYAKLIDAISGNGTWESNPLVYAYTFELVD